MKKLSLTGWLVLAGLMNACGGDSPMTTTDSGMMTDGGDTDGGMMTDGGDTDGGDTDGGMMTDGGDTDGGMMTDGGDTDGGMMTDGGMTTGDACEMDRIIAVSPVLGTPSTVMGDTTGAPANLMLHTECSVNQGQPIPLTPAPAQVVAITAPGTGTVAINFSMINDVTSPDFDTIVEVRRGGCGVNMGAVCFDDAVPGEEFRTSGSFTMMGGETVHLVVTNWYVNNPMMPTPPFAGPWQMTINAFEPHAPVITAEGTSFELIDGDRLELRAAGSDVDHDAMGVSMRFFDEAGMVLVASGGAGNPDITDWVFNFQSQEAGMGDDFVGILNLTGVSQIPELATMHFVDVTIFDATELVSMAQRVTIQRVAVNGLGGECGTPTARCAAPLTCGEGDTCVIPTDRVNACMAAMPITFVENAATATATVGTGMSVIDAACGGASSEETLFSVTVPMTGTYDLVVTTVDDATMPTVDTLLYSLAMCGDRSGMDVCADDVAQMDARSRLTIREAEPGHTFIIGAELFRAPMMSTMFPVHFMLIPVRQADEACDLDLILDRCATGTSCRANMSGMGATCVANGI